MRRTLAPLLSLLLAALAAAPAGCGSGQKTEMRPARDAEEVAPAGALPLSPEVTRGVLPNGLTFYVRANRKPEKRAVLWLVVNAGSALEDDDQRGLAHFLEHMAFNGTRRFAKQEIIDYLEKIGMRFGPDVNAFTSFDETVYQLELPSDTPASLQKGMDILHEWSQGIAIDPGEVDKERGVVLEERRLGRGAQGRLLDKLIPGALPGSTYGQRLPIGTEEILKTATPDTIRRFYRDWYRPELMAVVAVGDFDPAAMEKLIRARFGDLTASTGARRHAEPAVPPHRESVVLTVSDPELPITAVGVVHKQARRPLVTEADYRQSLVEQLFIAMINQRLDEARRAGDAAFLAAFVGKAPIVRPIDVWFQGAVVKGAEVGAALEAVTAEVARVGRSGFTAGEIERAKKNVLAGYQQGAREKDKTPSRSYAEEIQRHFLRDEAMPGIVAELALAERLLPAITGDQIRQVAATMSSEENRVIVAAGHASAKLPERAQLLAAVAAGKARAGAAYVDDASAEPLLERAPTPGTIARTRVLRELGVTEWTLSNGVTVVLKPTDFQNDLVSVTGRGPGGTSLAADADFLSADSAAAVAEANGFGKHTAVQLGKRLAGTNVGSAVAFGELETVLAGGGPAAEVEHLLQLLFLKATAPRADPKAFSSWRAQQIESLRLQLSSPPTVFDHAFTEKASNGHLRRRRVQAADYDKVDEARALAFYRARFVDMSGYAFVVVGAFDPERMKPLVLTYLGGLPGGKKAEKWRDVKVTRPAGLTKVDVTKGLEPQAQVRLLYHGKATWSREAEHEIAALSHALGIRLREELREGMGGVYGVGVQGDLARDPTGEYTVSVRFGCAPENVDKLIARARAEIAAFQKSGPPASVVDKVKASERRARETDLKDNQFWLQILSRYYRDRLDPKLILDHERLVASLTPRTLQAAARRYFGADQVVGVLRPER